MKLSSKQEFCEAWLEMQVSVESDKVVGRKVGNNGLKLQLKNEDILVDMSYFQDELKNCDDCDDIVRYERWREDVQIILYGCYGEKLSDAA